LAEKDLAEKLLESYNDVFADIVNGLLFNGVPRIKPESLSDDIVHSQYRGEQGKLHEEERDVLKRWNDYGINIAIMGFENQSKAEKYMPLRVIGYDGAAYRSQLLEENIKPVPVITIVLYFGNGHWNQPMNLKKLFDIPIGLNEYVSDYKINVFEVAWLSDEVINSFESDFRIVANFFKQKRLNKNYVPNDPQEIVHVDGVLKLLSAMTGDNRYEKILYTDKEVKTMCEVAERLEKIGFSKGISEGERTTVFRLVAKGKITSEDGANELEMVISDFEKSMQEAGFNIPECSK